MTRCPHCFAPVSVTDTAGNPWFACGATKTFRSASCIDREPLATELRKAQSRIHKLRAVLKAIADTDYRGNRSPEAALAEQALKEDEAT